MIDWSMITGFDWDDGNLLKSAEKHGVQWTEAEQVFLNDPVRVLEDTAHSDHEPRLHALGVTTQGRRLHVTFTLRSSKTLIRVISARDMHRKERAFYEQA